MKANSTISYDKVFLDRSRYVQSAGQVNMTLWTRSFKAFSLCIECPMAIGVEEETMYLGGQVTHYVFGKEKRALMITEQTSLTPPEG